VLWRTAKPMSARQSLDAHGKDVTRGKDLIIGICTLPAAQTLSPLTLSASSLLLSVCAIALILCATPPPPPSSSSPPSWPAPAAQQPTTAFARPAQARHRRPARVTPHGHALLCSYAPRRHRRLAQACHRHPCPRPARLSHARVRRPRPAPASLQGKS
jgi:hypothetical protein